MVELFKIREQLSKEKGVWIQAIGYDNKKWSVLVTHQLSGTKTWIEKWSAGNFDTPLLALEFGIKREIGP